MLFETTPSAKSIQAFHRSDTVFVPELDSGALHFGLVLLGAILAFGGWALRTEPWPHKKVFSLSSLLVLLLRAFLEYLKLLLTLLSYVLFRDLMHLHKRHIF